MLYSYGMTKAVMIDLETMAVTPRCVVLTLGAVQFDPHSDAFYDHLYMRLDIDDQDRLQREIDPGTLDWWAQQDAAVREEAFSDADRVPFSEAIDRFHKFCWNSDTFWSHGATFDLIVMEDIYRQLNRAVPWKYYQLRDTRTLFDLGLEPDMPQEGKHDALQDAVRQAIGVQNVYRQLRKLK